MIVSLGKMLDVDVVAEGIETEAQYRWLKTLNCAEFQGYFFAQPLPQTKFEQFHRQIRKNAHNRHCSVVAAN